MKSRIPLPIGIIPADAGPAAGFAILGLALATVLLAGLALRAILRLLTRLGAGPEARGGAPIIPGRKGGGR